MVDDIVDDIVDDRLARLARITTALGARAPSALRRGADWLMRIETADPVRRILSHGFVGVLLTVLVLALLTLSVYSSGAIAWLVVTILALWPAAFALNRRGSPLGAALLAVVYLLAVALLVPPYSYIVPHGVMRVKPLEFIIPILIGALFIGPRAALGFGAATFAVLTASGVWYGLSHDAIANFAVFGGGMLLLITVLLAAGSAQLTGALRRSIAANDRLEHQVAERTAELERSNAQLAAAKEHIERAAALRVKEVTEVVHDARNQIGYISAATELLVGQLEGAGLHGGSAARSERVIRNAVRGQQDLLDAMLEAALLEAGELVLTTQPTELGELVERVSSQVRPRFEQWGCALEVCVAEGLPLVLCDHRRIARVVQNVVNNALKYTASARRAEGRVRITLGADGPDALITVEDNGVGIAPEQLALLGRRFHRVAVGAGAPEGSGIGLNASVGILALHGGSLRLLSAGADCGTTAEVRLPLRRAP